MTSILLTLRELNESDSIRFFPCQQASQLVRFRLPLRFSQRTLPHINVCGVGVPDEETLAANDGDQIVQQRMRPIRRRIVRPTAVRRTAGETDLGQHRAHVRCRPGDQNGRLADLGQFGNLGFEAKVNMSGENDGRG